MPLASREGCVGGADTATLVGAGCRHAPDRHDSLASGVTGILAVTLLRGNIPQDEKFEIGTGVSQALQWYAEQLQSSRTPLVIAPETAIPVLPQQLPPHYWIALQHRFASGSQAAPSACRWATRRRATPIR